MLHGWRHVAVEVEGDAHAAIVEGNVGYVAALFKLSPVFTVVLAHIFLNEGGLRQRLTGSTMMAAVAVIVAV